MARSIRSIFYRLLLSYSLVGALPFAVAWLVIFVWGNTLVVRYVQTVESAFAEQVAREIDATIVQVTEMGATLARDPAILWALRPLVPRGAVPDGDLEQIELEAYQRIFQEIQGYLSVLEVHLTNTEGTRTFSSAEFSRRYDFSSQQTRDSFLTREYSSESRLLLAPGPGSEGSQIVFGVWQPLPGGALFLDVRTQALETPLRTRTSSRILLVDRQRFQSMNLLQPHDPTGFSEYPELRIVFTDRSVEQPEPDQLVHRRDLAAENLSVILITDLTTYFATLRQILIYGLMLVAGTSVITLIISVRISRSISRPIHDVIEAMTSSAQGPQLLPGGGSADSGDEMQELACHYNRMVQTIASLIGRVREEEKLLRVAERRALQAQIQPHFLYNTLGSIKSMAKLGDSAAVSAIVTDLGRILRFSLSDTEAMVPLREITDLVARYLNIQKIRFQERMQVTMELDPEAASILVPKLLVQPLAENSVVHGVEKSALPVTIKLTTRLAENVLQIRVEDTGPGPGRGAAVASSEDQGFGMGLINVRERLKLIYDDRAQFDLFREGERTVAQIRIVQ